MVAVCRRHPDQIKKERRLSGAFRLVALCRFAAVPLTSVPLHDFQRSTAAALCDLTTEALRTINATENAMVEFGLSEPVDRSHMLGTDAKQADEAFRQLEENVSLLLKLSSL